MGEIAERLRNFAVAPRADLVEIADQVEVLEEENSALKRHLAAVAEARLLGQGVSLYGTLRGTP